MLFWGFIFLVVGFIACLGLFLANLDLFAKITEYGFGGYLTQFFAKENWNTAKTAFIVVAFAFVLGIVLYFVGRAKNKEKDNPVIPAKLSKFFRDTKREYKNIVWPTFPAVVRNTGVTLAMCAVTAVVIIAFDAGLGALIQLLLSL